MIRHHQNPLHLWINSKVSVSRMSLRLAISFQWSSINFLCKVSTSIGNSDGSPYSAKIAWISVSCCPGLPSTFITLKGLSALLGLRYELIQHLLALPLYFIFWNKNNIHFRFAVDTNAKFFEYQSLLQSLFYAFLRLQ
jgi:hypothetical protein